MDRLIYLGGLLALLTLMACSQVDESADDSSHGGRSDEASGSHGDIAPNVPRGPSALPPLNFEGDGIPEGFHYLQLSSDDSTSMASAQLARVLPSLSASLHRHEFINYYDPDPALFGEEEWAIAERLEDAFDLGFKLIVHERSEEDTEGDTEEDNGDDADDEGDVEEGTTVDLLFQLRADPVDVSTRRPFHLIYCVDVSGSMSGEKIELVKDALRRSLAHLRAGDHVSLVSFSDDARTHLSFAEFSEREDEIRSAIEGLGAAGGTNMTEGLERAYAIAETHRARSHLSRVILFGDGEANIGARSLEHFASLTRIGNEEGIYLSSVGVGYNFDWERMDALADAGKGASIFLPDEKEVERMFGRDFLKLVEVAADEISIEFVLPEGMQLLDFSGEETSSDPDARVPSIILAKGDDMTLLARFSISDEAFTSRAHFRISMRPLGTGKMIFHEGMIESLDELVESAGPLYERTKIVDDYARFITTGSPAAAEVIAAIDAYGEGADEIADEGLLEIRELLVSSDSP